MTSDPITAAVTALHGVDHQLAARAMVNAIANSRGLPAPWDTPAIDLPALASVEQIGEVHQQLLGGQDGKRGQQGSYYTPKALSDFTARFVMDVNLSRLGDRHPLDMLVIDPACGAGALLVDAARRLTIRLIELEVGQPTDERVRGLLGYLARDVIFGIDIDPIAVDLARSALWLETDGTHPITWLDDNVIVGDALQGDEPPRMRARRAELQEMAHAHS